MMKLKKIEGVRIDYGTVYGYVPNTPCPFGTKDKNGIFLVGSSECVRCYKHIAKDFAQRVVICKGEEK